MVLGALRGTCYGPKSLGVGICVHTWPGKKLMRTPSTRACQHSCKISVVRNQKSVKRRGVWWGATLESSLLSFKIAYVLMSFILTFHTLVCLDRINSHLHSGFVI